MKGEIEIQKEHVQVMNTVHSRLYNILHKYTNNKNIKTDLISLLEFAFEDMQTVQKDINIEATTEQSKLASKD